jgi:hypothetical protein
VRLDLVRGEIDPCAGQQASKLLASVAVAALVVPERVVAIECDQIEGSSGHSFQAIWRSRYSIERSRHAYAPGMAIRRRKGI